MILSGPHPDPGFREGSVEVMLQTESLVQFLAVNTAEIGESPVQRAPFSHCARDDDVSSCKHSDQSESNTKSADIS